MPTAGCYQYRSTSCSSVGRRAEDLPAQHSHVLVVIQPEVCINSFRAVLHSLLSRSVLTNRMLVCTNSFRAAANSLRSRADPSVSTLPQSSAEQPIVTCGLQRPVSQQKQCVEKTGFSAKSVVSIFSILIASVGNKLLMSCS